MTVDTEVIDTHDILSFTESPSDLLAVGLANKTIPGLADSELIYPSVRCKLGNNAVWEHLISHPTQAARMRSLEVVREIGQTKAPESSNAQQPGELTDRPSRQEIEHSESLLIRAIHNMTNLDSFTWDRWVPTINRGEEAFERPGEIYEEDVWISLRNHTQLTKLQVVDLGRGIHQGFTDARPIFSSSLFTLRNLTHLVLKIYYSPDNPHEGENGDDEDSDYELLPPRVRLDRVRDMLASCPNLEILNLTVIDHDFYWHSEGNPFTDASLIISGLRLSELHTLILRDIMVRANVMVDFLNNHAKLRKISATLSLVEDDLQETPFCLEKCDFLQQDILPNIEYLHIPSKDLRPIVKAMKQPSLVRSLGVLQPEDWDIGEDLELRRDEHYVSTLDEVWGTPSEEVELEDEQSPGSDFLPLLTGANLSDLTVENVTSLTQLEDLIELTPQLERIEFVGQQIPSTPYTAYIDYLPYLSRWTHLTSLRATFIWPSDGYYLNPEETRSVVNDIATACPTLRELTWFDGQLARISKTDSGEARLELVSRK